MLDLLILLGGAPCAGCTAKKRGYLVAWSLQGEMGTFSAVALVILNSRGCVCVRQLGEDLGLAEV